MSQFLQHSPLPRKFSVQPNLHPTPSQYRDFVKRRSSLAPQDGLRQIITPVSSPIIFSSPRTPNAIAPRTPTYIYYPASRRTSIIDPLDLISLLPEEVILYAFSYLEVSDLYNACQVSYTWHRLCEDEFIFRTICYKSFPCLSDANKPPFEGSWHSFYEQKKKSFAVLGGPTAQSACMDDVCTKLRAAGLPIVDSHFTQKKIPTLEELQKYSAVLVYSYNSSAFLDGQVMGDVLADYVDNGGGVIVTVFTNCNNLRNGFIKGRFYEQGYHPLTPSRQHDTNGKKSLTLGKINQPNHPIMEGVQSLDGGRASFFCPGALNTEATLIAEWSNGVPLVAEMQKGKGRIVVLNFFPPSSDTGDPRFWLSSTDGDLIIANALAYCGRSSVLKRSRSSINLSQSMWANSISEDLKEGASTRDPFNRTTSSSSSSSMSSSSSFPGEKVRTKPDGSRRHRQIGRRLLARLFNYRSKSLGSPAALPGPASE